MSDEFQKRFQIIADLVDKNLNKIVRKTAIAADQTVVMSTPVDTGRARSNWLVGLDKPNRSTREPYSPGEKLGVGEGQNAAAAIAHGNAMISQYKNGQTIYISNNLPYIQPLNEGHSAQAPAGFVEAAVQEAFEVVKNSNPLDGLTDSRIVID